MKKNKLILFDWGNIVESFTTGYSCKKAWDDLFVSCGCKLDNVISYLSKYELSSIKNEMEFKKVYELIKKDLNLKVDYNYFVMKYDYFFDKVDFYENVKNYEISLKDKCYIGILSNLTIFDKKRLDKQVGLKNYDYVFLSFEIGIRKPNIEIFKYVQDNVPFDKKDILFIDDKLENIETAKSFGWNVLCCSGLELDKIKRTCDAFLK